jgi:2-(1,2-epoxy-1,2-dihydrophenyl)acetyl-CoA isomerase
MTYETIKLGVDEGLARITLARPDAANALDRRLASELLDAAIRVGGDPAVRAVLLDAEGGLFCGGGDLKSFAEQDDLPAYVNRTTVDFHAAVHRFARMDAPVVAAVHGAAGGAGLSIVAAIDLVVAADTAKFTMGYTRAGLVPDGTSTFFLARCVGLKRATDLVLTNRVLDAATAEAWGLVNRVVPAADVAAEAEALARSLAAGPTRSFGMAKRLLIDNATLSLGEAMERESAAITAAARTADGREGIDAFLAKRAPAFRGE